MHQRLWLLGPAVIMYLLDVTFTLCGQSTLYWHGEYHLAQEANPLADWLLKQSPWLFVLGAGAWLIGFSVMVCCWQHGVATWSAIILAMGHAVGSSTWLIKINSYGWFFAASYLCLAAQATAYCWRRYSLAASPISLPR